MRVTCAYFLPPQARRPAPPCQTRTPPGASVPSFSGPLLCPSPLHSPLQLCPCQCCPISLKRWWTRGALPNSRHLGGHRHVGTAGPAPLWTPSSHPPTPSCQLPGWAFRQPPWPALSQAGVRAGRLWERGVSFCKQDRNTEARPGDQLCPAPLTHRVPTYQGPFCPLLSPPPPPPGGRSLRDRECTCVPPACVTSASSLCPPGPCPRPSPDLGQHRLGPGPCDLWGSVG